MTQRRTQPGFRSAAAHGMLAQTIFRGVYEGSPNAYLILSPDLRIIEADAAYLAATMTRRKELVGRYMFDAFPDNPADKGATGVRNLSASLERALTLLCRDEMPLQRYDVRSSGGQWKIRYWHPTNWAITDDAGSPVALVHHVKEGKHRVPSGSLSDLVTRSRDVAATTADLISDLHDTLEQTRQKSEERLLLVRQRDR